MLKSNVSTRLNGPRDDFPRRSRSTVPARTIYLAGIGLDSLCAPHRTCGGDKPEAGRTSALGRRDPCAALNADSADGPALAYLVTDTRARGAGRGDVDDRGLSFSQSPDQDDRCSDRAPAPPTCWRRGFLFSRSGSAATDGARALGPNSGGRRPGRATGSIRFATRRARHCQGLLGLARCRLGSERSGEFGPHYNGDAN